MLWCEETSDVKALKENIAAYFNVLQGFLLFCHSSTVGAGPTLHKSIHGASKRVVDSSIFLFKETISFYGTELSWILAFLFTSWYLLAEIVVW